MTEDKRKLPKKKLNHSDSGEKSGSRLYWQMFMTFVRIGSFTIGGGYAMIPLIQKEVVENKKWMDYYME